MDREIFLPHAATARLRSGVAAHGRRWKHTGTEHNWQLQAAVACRSLPKIEKNEEGHMSKFESLSGSDESQLQGGCIIMIPWIVKLK